MTNKKTETVTKTNCRNCGKVTDKEFCSDICEKVYNREPKGAKPLQAAEEQNKVQKYCKECGKPIPNGLTFCSAKCIHEFRFKKEHPDKVMNDVYGDTFVKNGESEEPATEYMRRRQKEKEAEKKGKKTKPKQVEQKETKNSFRDLNIELIQKALETNTEIVLVPRRSHTIKGIPVRYDSDTYRIYMDTGRNIESVLLSEIGLFSFPKELYCRRD